MVHLFVHRVKYFFDDMLLIERFENYFNLKNVQPFIFKLNFRTLFDVILIKIVILQLKQEKIVPHVDLINV